MGLDYKIWRRIVARIVALLTVLSGVMAAALLGGCASAALAERDITLCILDSGSNLEGAVGWNYLDGSGDITDREGHGTRISSLASELAPDAQIRMLKCFEKEMQQDNKAICEALEAAVDDYDADIILMSWAVTEEDQELHEALQYACAQGAVPVAAAGNLGVTSGLGSTAYPAAWDEVIGVGGVDLDQDGQLSSSLWYLKGEAVYVCARADWDHERGTSFAAARVAAYLAAHMQEQGETKTGDGAEASAYPTLEAARSLLRQQALDLGEPGYDTTYGWGYIDTDH